MPLATPEQQAELYALLWAGILAKGEAIHIPTDSG